MVEGRTPDSMCKVDFSGSQECCQPLPAAQSPRVLGGCDKQQVRNEGRQRKLSKFSHFSLRGLAVCYLAKVRKRQNQEESLLKFSFREFCICLASLGIG